MENRLTRNLAASIALILSLSPLTTVQGVWTGDVDTDLTAPLNWSALTTPGPASVATFTDNLAMLPCVITPTSLSPTFTPGEVNFTQDVFVLEANGQNIDTAIALRFTPIGTGVKNDSGVFQTIKASNGGTVEFNGSSSADITATGKNVLQADAVDPSFPSKISFKNTSTASNAKIEIGNVTTKKNKASAEFTDNATAGLADIKVKNTGVVQFKNTTTAAGASIALNPTGPSAVDGVTTLSFKDSSNPSSSTIAASNGGNVTFDTTSSTTASKVALDTGSTLDVRKTIEIQSLASASPLDITTLHNSNLTINNPAVVSETIAGKITGDGVLNKDGVSTLSITNTGNDYSATNIVNGTLIASTSSLPGLPDSVAATVSPGANLMFNDTAAGIFSGDIENHGEVKYSGIASSTIEGKISGSGTFKVDNGGHMTLLGANTYVGGTDVTGGSTLAGNATSLQDAINLTDSTLVFDQTKKETFNGTITGDNTSVINKMGPETLVINTPQPMFTGTTNIHVGNFNLNAFLGGNVFVTNGTLSGDGTIEGNVVMQNGSSISPGNSIGTLEVGGNYTHDEGSVYIVEFNEFGQSDLIAVTGIATLNGGNVIGVEIGEPVLSGTYTILTANGAVVGQFSGVSTTNYLLSGRLIYDPNHVFLTIERRVFSFNAVTPNQIAVAHQLESINNPTLAEFQVLSALDSLSPSAQHAALNQMSGEQYASLNLAAEITGRQFIRRLYDPLRSIVTKEPCNECCCECECQPLDFWFELGGGQSFIDGNCNARGFKLNGYEATVGVQSIFNCDWTVGIAASYAQDCIKYDIGNHGKNRMVFGGIYGLYRPSAFYVLADVGFGGGQFSVNRSIDVGYEAYSAKGRPNHYQGLAYIEAGFDWNTCNLLIQPFLGFEGGCFSRDNVSESGDGPLNLNVHKQAYGNAHSRLGFHMTTEEWSALKLSIDVAWDCRLTSAKDSITENFQGFGDSFTITGISRSRNSVDVAVTGSGVLCEGWEVYLETSGQLWSKVSTYSVLGGIKYSW